MSNHGQRASIRNRVRRWAGVGCLVLFAGCVRTPPPVAQAMPVAVYTAPEPPRRHVARKPSPVLVRDIQGELMRLDYLQSAPDGSLGPKTRSAMRQFEREHGLRVSDTVSKSLLDRLQATPSSAAPPAVAAGPNNSVTPEAPLHP